MYLEVQGTREGAGRQASDADRGSDRTMAPVVET